MFRHTADIFYNIGCTFAEGVNHTIRVLVSQFLKLITVTAGLFIPIGAMGGIERNSMSTSMAFLASIAGFALAIAAYNIFCGIDDVDEGLR